MRTKSPLIIIIIVGHDHHHQTDLSSERERGPDDSDEEGYSRLLTFPHPISITIPYLTCMYMLLANRKISNGPYIPRRCSTREGAGGREGGREGKSPVQGCALSLSLFFLEGEFLAFTVFCFYSFGLLTFFGVLVRFIDLTLFIIFQSESDNESFPPSQSTLGDQIDRTGLVRWVFYHTKDFPMLVYTRAKYKICEFFVLRKLARWPLTRLLYMLCPNIDTCQLQVGIIACLFHARTSYVHPV